MGPALSMDGTRSGGGGAQRAGKQKASQHGLPDAGHDSGGSDPSSLPTLMAEGLKPAATGSLSSITLHVFGHGDTSNDRTQRCSLHSLVTPSGYSHGQQPATFRLQLRRSLHQDDSTKAPFMGCSTVDGNWGPRERCQ